jgi:hypothetical protein
MTFERLRDLPDPDTLPALDPAFAHLRPALCLGTISRRLVSCFSMVRCVPARTSAGEETPGWDLPSEVAASAAHRWRSERP